MNVKLALNLEYDKEELYWAQRARVNWLQHGNRNSAFFHRAISHSHRNRIALLEEGGGQVLESNTDIV